MKHGCACIVRWCKRREVEAKIRLQSKREKRGEKSLQLAEKLCHHVWCRSSVEPQKVGPYRPAAFRSNKLPGSEF